MINKISRIFNLLHNMGPRYTGFRIKYELLKRSGLLKSKFPASPPFRQYPDLNQWRSQPQQFFFKNKSAITVPANPDPALALRYNQLTAGKFLLFNSIEKELGTNYDWITNPDSGHKYDTSKHWTEIPDLSKEAGDIKYVWEKSRFSYLYDIIRYDYHFKKDCSAMVFGDILSWIKSNPINCGPNYRCSQEMSLRVLNWTFALHYYRDSDALTTDVFNAMLYTIYWHLHHIYNNIDFSRIAVRNNHAITETLALYLGGLLYPTLPDAALWKAKGKAWFEQEIAYQIYEDGTFLQFSMNYHRIVVQLLTWGIVLSEKNGECFSDVVYDRARKSVKFLRTCMVDENGWLPNYGANDGALFFPLSNTHYRDYRPQLQTLAAAIGMSAGIEGQSEDTAWYGIPTQKPVETAWQPTIGISRFDIGGYYVIREHQTLTFIKCGSYKDRPSQADNLHIDIWYQGENILTDAGSYKYNTDDDTIRYFSGTQSHNTLMLGNNDQMLKGGRFIWYYWTQALKADIKEDVDTYSFSGTVRAFGQVGKNITHTRTVTKHKEKPVWEVRDTIVNAPPGIPRNQLWHIPVGCKATVGIHPTDDSGNALPSENTTGWSSSLYGLKEKTMEICVASAGNEINTVIQAK